MWAVATSAGATDDLRIEQRLEEAQAAYGKVGGYTAILHKQQRVAGKLLPEETIFLKFRKPFSVYMKWIRAPHKGSELIYVEGRNGNRVRAHRGGLLRFVTRDLDPRSPELMTNNLRPVTDIGIGQLITIISSSVHAALRNGDLRFADRGQERVYGRTTRILEITVSDESAGDVDARRIVINEDVEHTLPIRIRMYDREDRLLENYGYEDLKLDPPLADADFDPRNSSYRFRR